VAVAYTPAIEKERAEKPLDERCRIALLLRPCDEPMAVERVRLAFDAIESEWNANGCACLRHASIYVVGARRAAELLLDIARAWDAIGRKIGIELEWMPAHFDAERWVGAVDLAERDFELALADEAPRTDDVRHHVDRERGCHIVSARSGSSEVIAMSVSEVARMRSLHRRFRLEALEVAINGSDGERAAVAHIAHDAVALGDVAVDCYLVPTFGVSDVVDRNVVVLAPEERDRIESLAATEHVERGGLAMPLGDDPVLDADCRAAVRVGPAGDVAGRIDIGRAGLQEFVDGYTAVDRQAGSLRKLQPRPHADAHDDEIRLDRAAALQR